MRLEPDQSFKRRAVVIESMALLFWGHRNFRDGLFYFSRMLGQEGVKGVKSIVVVSKGRILSNDRTGPPGIPLPDLKGKNVLINPTRPAGFPRRRSHHPSFGGGSDHQASQETGAGRIVIGESCISEWMHRRPSSDGMKEVSEENRVELVDLDQGAPMEIAIPGEG